MTYEKGNTVEKAKQFLRTSVTLKIISIGILLILLGIPTSMVSSVMREREWSRDSVIREISDKWGGSQVFTGPFITVPYRVYFKDKDDKVTFNIRYFHILPQKLNITGTIDTEIRYRSLYEAVLYNTILQVSRHLCCSGNRRLRHS